VTPSTGAAATLVQTAFHRWVQRSLPSSSEVSSVIADEGVDIFTAIQSVSVKIVDEDVTLGPSTNESYTLSITNSGIDIHSQTVYGAMHAFVSLWQLTDIVYENSSNKILSASIPNAPISVDDAPRFGYRGLLVDTGRHFLPVSFLKNIIDGLEMNKLNVLHWHIVDAQSFPCGSKTFPELAEKGAYSFPAASYSTEDLKALVAYGKERGVRIMPEWDIPGHGSWGKGRPDVMACSDVLDPTKPSTYTFLNEFFTEMMSIFDDEYVFLGGDEVELACWDNNPSVAAWLKQHNMNSSQLQQYFWKQMSTLVLPKAFANRTISIWENDKLQIAPSSLPKGTVANVYQSKATADVTIGKYGMPSVLSIAGNNWYLDSQCSGYNWNSWECRYTVEPTSNVTKEHLDLLLGGESAMWGEGINKDNFDAYVWHGAAAVGERLWSPAATTQSISAMQPRLASQMCRMTQENFRVGPIFPGFCPADAY